MIAKRRDNSSRVFKEDIGGSSVHVAFLWVLGVA